MPMTGSSVGSICPGIASFITAVHTRIYRIETRTNKFGHIEGFVTVTVPSTNTKVAKKISSTSYFSPRSSCQNFFSPCQSPAETDIKDFGHAENFVQDYTGVPSTNTEASSELT